MLRFRLLNIPIAIGPYFWIGSALFGSNQAQGKNAVPILLVWMACVFVSIVVHEMGHALAARSCGVSPEIELHGIGGLTRYAGPALSRGQRLFVIAAGPAAGLALYYVVELIAPPLAHAMAARDVAPDSLSFLAAVYAVSFLLFINLSWTLFNLVPVQPLDGGQMLREILGPRRVSLARIISIGCAFAVAAWALANHQLYMACFLAYLGVLNFRAKPRAIPGEGT